MAGRAIALIYVQHHAANLHESVLRLMSSTKSCPQKLEGGRMDVLALGCSRIAAARVATRPAPLSRRQAQRLRNKPRRYGHRPNQLIHKSRNWVATTCS